MKKRKIQKQTEEKTNLSSSIELDNLIRIYNSVPIPIAIYDDSDSSVKVNLNFTQTYGYSDTDIKTLDDWWNLCIRDVRLRHSLKEEWWNKVQYSITNKTQFEPMEMEIQCKNGEKKFIQYSNSVVDSFYVGFFPDITELKKAMEQKLLVSEKRTKSLLYAPKNIPQVIFDHKGTILEINEAAIQETKLKAKELISKNVFSIMNKYGIKNVYRFDEVLKNKEAINLQEEFLDSRYDIELYPLLNENEEVEKVALYARNLSNMFLKEKLLDSETRFKSFMEYGPFRAYIKNQKGIYVYGNPAAREFIKNYSDKAFVGSKVDDFFDKKTTEEMNNYDKQIINTLKPVIIEPHPHTDKNGITSYMKEIKFPIKASNDQILIGGIVLDVTEEVLLQQNLMLTQFSVENSGIGIVWTDDQGKFIYANNYAVNAFGYSKEEFLSLHVWDITPEYTPKVSKEFIEGMSDSGVYSNETIARRKDGSEFPIYINVNNLNTRDKMYMFGYFFDLSERKEEEKKLRLAQFTMDYSSMPILTINSDAEIIYVNNEAIKIFGYSKEEMLQMKAYDLSSDTDPLDFSQRIARIDKLGHDSGETRIKKSDGDFPAYVTVNRLEINDEIFYNVFLQDLTIQKINEMELNKLFNATQQSPISVVITDILGNIEYVNPKFCDVTGYTIEELLGKNPRVLKSGYTSLKEYEELWSTIKNGEIWQGTFRNVKKNGDFFWESATISPIYGPDRKIQNFLGIKEDITEKITLQEQLIQSQKMEGMGRLAGGIAHDFNNILTVIMGTAQLLDHELLDDTTRDSLSEILKAGNKAAGLTRQLLAFSKKQLLKPTLVNLNRVLLEMETMLRRILPENIEFQLNLQDTQPITIKVDKPQLEQVILNLVINAKEAMMNGGKLAISTSINSKHIGNELRYNATLTIQDTGIGMDEETKKRLYEPFFTTKEKGTGLGLATVYGIIAQSEGEIEVKSNPGEGATFTINFPLRLNAIEEDEEVIIKRPEFQGTETILLIEDENSVRKVLFQILKNEGYTVWMAENGESAILNYAHLVKKIDLIISDVIMPIMGGVEVVAKFHELDPTVKVLFISGYAGDENTVKDEDTFITKPIERIQLLRKIREILG